MPFVHQRRIRFQDADPAGIVFFGHVLGFCHEAYEELLCAEGLPIERLLAEGLGYPLRHAEVDFLAPMRVGVVVAIAVAVAKVGGSSFRVEYVVRDQAGLELARAATVHVTVDRAAMKSAPLPADLRALLERHLRAGDKNIS